MRNAWDRKAEWDALTEGLREVHARNAIPFRVEDYDLDPRIEIDPDREILRVDGRRLFVVAAYADYEFIHFTIQAAETNHWVDLSLYRHGDIMVSHDDWMYDDEEGYTVEEILSYIDCAGTRVHLREHFETEPHRTGWIFFDQVAIPDSMMPPEDQAKKMELRATTKRLMAEIREESDDR